MIPPNEPLHQPNADESPSDSPSQPAPRAKEEAHDEYRAQQASLFDVEQVSAFPSPPPRSAPEAESATSAASDAHPEDLEPNAATPAAPETPQPDWHDSELPVTGGPESDTEIPPATILTLPIDQLDPLPDALRRPGSQRQRERLLESLRHGQIQPIQVRALESGRYQILDGHDVVDALRKLGQREVRAVIQPLTDPAMVMRHVLGTNFPGKRHKPGHLVYLCPALLEFTGSGLRRYELAALLGVDPGSFSEYCGYGEKLSAAVLARAGVDPVCDAKTLHSISRDDYRWITEPGDELEVAIRLSYRVHGTAPDGVSERQARRHRPKEKPISAVTQSKRLTDPEVRAAARPRQMTRAQIKVHVADYEQHLLSLCLDDESATGSDENESTSEETHTKEEKVAGDRAA